MLLAALPRPRPAPRRAAFLIANTNRERAPARQNLKTPFCLHRGTHTHTERSHIRSGLLTLALGYAARCTFALLDLCLPVRAIQISNQMSREIKSESIQNTNSSWPHTHTHTPWHYQSHRYNNSSRARNRNRNRIIDGTLWRGRARAVRTASDERSAQSEIYETSDNTSPNTEQSYSATDSSDRPTRPTRFSHL